MSDPFTPVLLFTCDLEQFTYISPMARRAWKSGELEEVERILSREIENEPYEVYGRANRALVRARRGNLKGALDDARVIMVSQLISLTGMGPLIPVYGQADSPLVPPIAHIAEAMALMRQGKEKRKEVVDARRENADNFVDCVKVNVISCGVPLVLNTLVPVCHLVRVRGRDTLWVRAH